MTQPAFSALSIFEKILLYDEDPVDRASYEEKATRRFQSDASQASWVDVYRPHYDGRNEIMRSEDHALALSPSEHVRRYGTTGAQSGYLGFSSVPVVRAITIDELDKNLDEDFDREDRMSMFFVRQSYSWSRLQIKKDLFDVLLSYTELSPRVRRFVIAFHHKVEENDPGAPALHFQPRHFNMNVHGVESLGPRAFECAFTLRYVDLSRQARETRPWAERQTTICSSCKVLVRGLGGRQWKSKWLLLSASTAMQDRLDEYCRGTEEEKIDPFKIYLILIHSASSNWPPYLAYLTEETNKKVNKTEVTDVDGGDMKTVEMVDRQGLKLIEDRLTDMFVMLDSTLHTIRSLAEKYQILCKERRVTDLSDILDDSVSFVFYETEQQLLLTRKKVEALHLRVQGTVQLLSSALDLENGHSLKTLAEESREESKTMRALTEKATSDATAVKVLTIITLTYLPATAVLNFFSTNFVSREQSGSSTTLAVASDWWLFLAISLPLTALTLSIWWLVVRRDTCLESARLLMAHLAARKATLLRLHPRAKAKLGKAEP